MDAAEDENFNVDDLAMRNKTSLKVLRCFDCERRFSNTIDMAQHMLEHEEVDKYKCIECESTFKKLKDMRDHCKSIHFQKNLYKCKICNETFQRLIDLRKHQQNHKQDTSLITEECLVILKDVILLPNGTQAAIYRCNICRQGFNLKTDLERHFLIHLGMKPYKCPVCELRVNRKTNLNRHMKNKHGYTIPEIKEVKNESKKYPTENTVLPLPGNWSYKCSLCDVYYCKQASSMSEHYKEYHGLMVPAIDDTNFTDSEEKYLVNILTE